MGAVATAPRVPCSRWGTRSRSPSYVDSAPAGRTRAGWSASTSPRPRFPGWRPSSPTCASLPFPDAHVDQVLLVSKLEHIGADNEVYGYEEGPRRRQRPSGGSSQAAARATSPTGRLLVTVPLGEPGDYGWFRQEDTRGWNRLFARGRLLRRGAGAVRAGRGRLGPPPRPFGADGRPLRRPGAGRVGRALQRAVTGPTAAPRQP